MKYVAGKLTSDSPGAPVGSRSARKPPSNVSHGHTSVARKPRGPVFATSEAQTETGQPLFEVPAMGKNKLQATK